MISPLPLFPTTTNILLSPTLYMIPINMQPPIFRIAICPLHSPLNPCDEIEVAVERRRRRELVAP